MIVTLSNGELIVIDACDFILIMSHRWAFSPAAGSVLVFSNKKTRYLHREIMNCPVGMVVDHIDGNPLNNQRSNLRICTQSQNTKNQKRPKNNTSGFKGVYLAKRATMIRWVAQIKVNRKRIYLGGFPNKEDAARAYNEAALKHFGSFAKLNEV